MHSIEVEASSAINDLRKLQELLEMEIPEAVGQQADKGAENVKKVLRKQSTNPSSASGQAERSIRSKQTGDTEYVVVGNAYLDLVETGTEPHIPDVSGRLIVWATQEGWDINDIVSHIKYEGTDKHPFKEKSFDPIRKLLPQRVTAHVRRNVNI